MGLKKPGSTMLSSFLHQYIYKFWCHPLNKNLGFNGDYSYHHGDPKQMPFSQAIKSLTLITCTDYG